MLETRRGRVRRDRNKPLRWDPARYQGRKVATGLKIPDGGAGPGA